MRGDLLRVLCDAPALGLSYFARKGQGAWKQRKGEDSAAIRTRPADPDHLCVVASKDHASPRVKTMIERLTGAQLTSMGSSLKFCLVAEGKADLYPRFNPTMEWDTAAAQCVVECAGGAVLTLDGAPLKYQRPDMKNPPILTVGDPSFRWKDVVGEK